MSLTAYVERLDGGCWELRQVIVRVANQRRKVEPLAVETVRSRNACWPNHIWWVPCCVLGEQRVLGVRIRHHFKGDLNVWMRSVQASTTSCCTGT